MIIVNINRNLLVKWKNNIQFDSKAKVYRGWKWRKVNVEKIVISKYKALFSHNFLFEKNGKKFSLNYIANWSDKRMPEEEMVYVITFEGRLDLDL